MIGRIIVVSSFLQKICQQATQVNKFGRPQLRCEEHARLSFDIALSVGLRERGIEGCCNAARALS